MYELRHHLTPSSYELARNDPLLLSGTVGSAPRGALPSSWFTLRVSSISCVKVLLGDRSSVEPPTSLNSGVFSLITATDLAVLSTVVEVYPDRMLSREDVGVELDVDEPPRRDMLERESDIVSRRGRACGRVLSYQ